MVENKTRSSFKELLAKYEKEGAAQKQKLRLNKVKDAKTRTCKQSDLHPYHGNGVDMPHSGSVTL